MTIYEIDQQITSLVDPETGVILDYEAFEALAMERDKKTENMALWVKDLTAESKAIAEEIKALTERKRAADNKAESLKRYLMQITAGEKFKTAKVSISYRHSKSVSTDEYFIAWAQANAEDLIRYRMPEVDKTAVKAAIEGGRAIEHASLEENTSISIK